MAAAQQRSVMRTNSMPFLSTAFFFQAATAKLFAGSLISSAAKN
jgi:hypothetical protein